LLATLAETIAMCAHAGVVAISGTTRAYFQMGIPAATLLKLLPPTLIVPIDL
jgi:hypothetical protein